MDEDRAQYEREKMEQDIPHNCTTCRKARRCPWSENEVAWCPDWRLSDAVIAGECG